MGVPEADDHRRSLSGDPAGDTPHHAELGPRTSGGVRLGQGSGRRLPRPHGRVVAFTTDLTYPSSLQKLSYKMATLTESRESRFVLACAASGSRKLPGLPALEPCF